MLVDIPYCTCDDRRSASYDQDYRRKIQKMIPRSRAIRAKQQYKGRKPNYYCICNNPNRPCICNKRGKLPPPAKMKREILRNGQKYTYLPNWLVGRLIDIFKEQEKRKSKPKVNMSDPEILALGVKKGERRRKSDPPKKLKTKPNEENKQQQQQEKQPQQQQHQHHGENRNN